jgi:capsular polysaccharide transport system permease protein
MHAASPVVSPTPPGQSRRGIHRETIHFQRLRVLFALVVREMNTKFGRSYGGYIWAIAEPLGGVMLLNLAFSLTVRRPPLGTNFPLFYATGIVPFFLFTGISGSVANAVITNRGLLHYPVVSPLDAVFGKFILDFTTMLVVGILLSGGIIIVYALPVTLDPVSALTGFTLAGLLGLGVGTINCVLFGMFPTWRNIWNVMTKPLFIVSGTFFIYESAPASFQAIMWWNPIVHVVALVRAGFYGSYNPYYVSIPYVLAVAGSLFVIGAYLLRRHASWLIEN